MRFGATGRRSEAHRHRHTYKAHTVAHARRVHAVRITCNAQFARVRRGIISYDAVPGRVRHGRRERKSMRTDRAKL